MSHPRGRSLLERLSPDALWVLVDHLEYPDVHNLARCSQTLHHNVDFFLYSREVNDRSHHALHYAVDKMPDDIGVRTITKLSRHVRPKDTTSYFNVRLEHEDGYSYPLHLAALRDKINQVQKLLTLGADAGALCPNLTLVVSRGQRKELKAMNLYQILRSCQWRAILGPILNGNRALERLLYHEAPSAIVAQGRSSNGRAITLHHFAVLVDRPRLLGAAITRHPQDINVQTPRSGQTALHLAILHEKGSLVDKLIHVTNLNSVFNREGSNVLHFAIEQMYLSYDSATRRWVAQVVERLVAHGADPNQSRANTLGETPLLMATDAVRFDWYKVWRDAKPVIDLLLRQGADINKADANGSTPLTMVLMKMIREPDHGAMKTLFLDFVQNHGADLNLRTQVAGLPVQSIMSRLIDVPRMAAFCRMVMELGGRVAQHEVQWVFRKWYQCAT
ncbi:hypothetical protein ACHAPT_007772 [Fusarium lateritium]